MSVMTIKEASELWGISERRISTLCKTGRIQGAAKLGSVWTIPSNTEKPQDILLVSHGGWHNDTICTVEIKIDNGISEISQDFKTVSQKTIPVIQETMTDKILIDKIQNLPNNFWDFKNHDTQELTHGLHSYPAMMIYPISRNILKIMKSIMPIETILDPFAGSGTVLVESVLAGITNIYGNDLNPLSKLLTCVKTHPLNPDSLSDNYETLVYTIDREYTKYKSIIEQINSYFTKKLNIDLTTKDGWGNNAPKYLEQFYKINHIHLAIPDFKNIGYWFKPSVIMELQIIKNAIKEIKDINIQNFFWVTYSETIRLVSNRRNGEFKMFRMKPEKVVTFNPDVRNEFYKLLERNLNKIQIFSEICYNLDTHFNIKILSENSENLTGVPDNSIDIVITSPPYGDSKTTVAYGEYSRLSLQWLDLYDISDKDIMDIDKKLMGGTKYRNGFEFTLKSDTLKKSLKKIEEVDIKRAGDVFSFYKDLDAVIRTVAQKTKENGYQFWVVGNRTVKNENLKTDVIITELAKQYKLKHVYTIDRFISNKVMPSKNSPSNKAGNKAATMINEHIVILRKTI